MRTTAKQKAKPHPVFERTGENSIRISALPATSAATNNPAPSEMWPQRPYAASV